MPLQIFDRGYSLDVKLDPLELQRGLRLEEHTEVLDRYLSEKDGTYGWQGVMARGQEITVPKATLKDGISASERTARVRARIANGDPPLLVSYDPATDTPLFAEEDKEAYEAGYICAGCFQWQSVPHAPSCNWLRPNDGDHLDSKDRGCGHRNY